MIIKPIKTDQSAPVKFIIVGADRIVENGDTANKIGTFQLSTIANFSIPIDLTLKQQINKLSLLLRLRKLLLI